MSLSLTAIIVLNVHDVKELEECCLGDFFSSFCIWIFHSNKISKIASSRNFLVGSLGGRQSPLVVYNQGCTGQVNSAGGWKVNPPSSARAETTYNIMALSLKCRLPRAQYRLPLLALKYLCNNAWLAPTSKFIDIDIFRGDINKLSPAWHWLFQWFTQTKSTGGICPG